MGMVNKGETKETKEVNKTPSLLTDKRILEKNNDLK